MSHMVHHKIHGPSNPSKATWQAGRSPQEVDVGSSTLGPEYPDVPSYVGITISIYN